MRMLNAAKAYFTFLQNIKPVMKAFSGGDRRKGSPKRLPPEGGKTQATTAPRKADAAPKQGPKTIPITQAIKAAKLISRFPTPVGIRMGAINERT